MIVESWPIDRVKPYDRNPRQNDGGVDAVARSLREFGFRQPIVVDSEGVVVVGHTRLKAAQSLRMTEVPVHVADGLTPEQARAYRIADNQTSNLSAWDYEKLRLEAVDLEALGVDLDLLGFGDVELAEIMATPAGELGDPEEIPEAPAEPIARPGDLWTLGKHRLLCGDSTVATDVERLLGDAVPFMMVTDPPYGVEYDADWRNNALRANGTPIAGRAVGKVENDDRVDWTVAYAMFPGHVAYVWHADRHASDVVLNLAAAGFEMRCQLIWAKSNFAIGRGHYHWGHEPCWYAVRKGGNARWCGDRTQSTVWNIAKPSKSETGHSTQKPVECMARPIRNHGGLEDDVYDPFGGSGTTMIACEQLGRRCLMMELAPRYCDVIVARWEKFTGLKAVLEKAGG